MVINFIWSICILTKITTLILIILLSILLHFVSLTQQVDDAEKSLDGSNSIQCVKFSSDASLLASCDLGGNIVLYDGQVI